MFGDWSAGFASGVSGGYLTDLYEVHSGNKFEPTNGALWGAGNVTGIGVSFLLGMKLPVMAATKVGPLQWVAAAGMGAQTGLDIYGAAQATGNLYQSYQDNGQWELQDTWNLLAYVPFVGMTLGVAKGVGAARRVKGGTPGVDDVMKNGPENTKSVTAGGGPQCFVAGTEILTTEGIKNIEDIRVGDWVIADDPTIPGGIEARQVLDTFVRETDALVDLYVDGEVISTTGEHPFWVPDQGWVEAKDLIVGSLLQTADGRVVDVDKVEKREGKFEVYNFKVEGIPTYFVSELGVLVHNTNCGDGPTNDMWDDLEKEINNPSYDPRTITPGGRKLSQHADIDSLKRHGFSEPYNDVDNIIDNPSRVTQQSDGATVYIQLTNDNKYNIAIVNLQDNSLITAMQGLTKPEVRSLGRNNGFNPNF